MTIVRRMLIFEHSLAQAVAGAARCGAVLAVWLGLGRAEKGQTTLGTPTTPDHPGEP